jgi:hypothetical protein
LFNFELNVVQSVDDNKPFDDPDAVAISIVIVPLDVTGVDPIVTPVVVVLIPMLVTVPTLHDLSALRSYAVPLIVNVRDVGTAPIVVVVMASHTGADDVVPSPVCDKNILVVVTFGDLLNGIPTALE